MSSGSSPPLSLSPTKDARGSTKTKLRKRPSHHPTFSDVVSGTSRRARREAVRRQNQLVQALGNTSVFPEGTMPRVLTAGMMPSMPLVHLAFRTRPTFYVPLADPMKHSSPLGQHILDYELPHGFVISAFSTFDGSFDPYDHMLHSNQTMILNDGNDRLLCKVFQASLRGPTLAWFHKLPRN